MWETILSIIIKYWVEFLLGLIVAGGSVFFKRYAKLEKEERQRIQEEHYRQLEENIKKNNEDLIERFSTKYQEGMTALDNQYKEITTQVQEVFEQKDEIANKEHEKLNQKIDATNNNYNILREGILSLQGNMFKDKCRKLLKEDHIISLDEWEDVDVEHDIYKALGGNHNGDYLYQLVSEKVKNTLTDKD